MAFREVRVCGIREVLMLWLRGEAQHVLEQLRYVEVNETWRVKERLLVGTMAWMMVSIVWKTLENLQRN